MTDASSIDTGTVPGLDGTTRAAIADDLRLLAALHGREPTVDLLSALDRSAPGDLFAFTPASETGRAAVDLFLQVVRATARDREELDGLAADHAAIYLTHTHRVSPSESPWIDPEGLMAQEPMFAVRDWYRHYGLAVPDWRIMPDDHLVHQLLFVAHLMALTDRPHAVADAGRFLDRHLLRWFPAFAAGVTARCWTPYWAALVQLTDVWLGEVRMRIVAATGLERETPEPIEDEKERRRLQAARGESCGTFLPDRESPPGW